LTKEPARDRGAGGLGVAVRRVVAGVLESLPSDVDAALDVAARRFARWGVEHTSVPDIARDLGVSRATVYRKFGTVDGMAWLLFARNLDRALGDAADSNDAIADAVWRSAPGHALTNGAEHGEPYLKRVLLPRFHELLGPGHEDLVDAVARRALASSCPSNGTAPQQDMPAAAEMRDRVLDAAESCFRRFGLASTTIDDVVREANVPRATLYRHAGGKAELIAGVLRRETERALAELQAFLATREDFASIIVDGTLFLVDKARSDLHGEPLIGILFAKQRSTPSDAAVDAVRDVMWRELTEFVAPLVEHAHETGEARPELTVEDATEWLMRCARSFIESPDTMPRTREARRAFLQRMFLPAFVPDQRRPR
jgi:AcrR family transcriptional regulator